jgi:hypothetical protein
MRFLTSAFEWKCLADTLKDILTECFFLFEEKKITMNNVDPQKVVDVYYEETPDPEKYICATAFQFPVYIQTLYRVLRGVKSKDTMEMSDLYDGSLQIIVYSEFGCPKNHISLKPLKEEIPTYIRNPRTYEVGISMLNDQFYHIVHDLGALSRQVTIHVEDQTIQFKSRDESGTESSYSQTFTELAPSYFFNNTYLLKFLEKYTKPGLQKFINIRMDKNLPLSVVYYLDRGFLEMTIAGLE